jgi:hypothetical protein
MLMSITIAKQIELRSRNFHDEACIVGTKFHLSDMSSVYNIDETKLVDYPVSNI